MKSQIQIYLIIAILSISFSSCTKVGHIHGTIKNAETGDLLENVKIEISPSNMSSILTNSTGEFTFSDLNEGLYTISVSKDGYTTTSKDFTVDKGNTTNADFSLKKEQIEILELTISNATNITASSASVLGNITELGESNITAHGHCWNNTAAPNINDNKTDYGTANETGEFTSPITNLQANTTYYIRTFATNSEGTIYSNEISFTTIGGTATVSINNPTNIDYQTITANGNISNLGMTNPTQHGFIWSETNSNPTTTNNDGIKELGNTSITGSFMTNLMGFVAVTDYYIRAFVTNSYGTEYSEVITFSTKENFTYGGQTYQVVQIGNQIWMAENLNYETTNSWWYDNQESNGNIYGRLYTWDDANSACPSGWHLPSDNEWKTLEMELGMSQSDADAEGWRGTNEGYKLKSTTGWYNSGNGNDESKFTALPGGIRNYGSGSFYYIKNNANWWCASIYDEANAWLRVLSYNNSESGRGYDSKNNGNSIRCIRN